MEGERGGEDAAGSDEKEFCVRVLLSKTVMLNCNMSAK